MRHRIPALLAIAFLFSLSGCGEIDWNWDPAWWKRQKRVVRPTRPAEQQRASQKEDSDRREVDDRHADTRRRDEPPPPSRPSDDRDTVRIQPRDDGAAQDRSVSDLPIRPFYNLYLISETREEAESPRGEGAIHLSKVTARTCAQVLEMLYVPVGRPGGLTECYLIYENRDEFEAAARFASRLDLAPLRSAPSTIGPEDSLAAGIALLYHLLESGPMVDRPTAEACTRKLSEAAQAEPLEPILRWAAGILAGRVATAYLYDYAGARSFYQQAQRVMPEDSVEVMTTRWWRADAFVQEGNPAEADLVYQGIITKYEGRWKDAQIVRRSKALLEQSRKR